MRSPRRPRAHSARPARPPAKGTGDAAHRRELHSQTCVACHGADGCGGIYGAALATTNLSPEKIVTTVCNERDQLPTFGRAYRPEDVQDVAEYIQKQLATH